MNDPNKLRDVLALVAGMQQMGQGSFGDIAQLAAIDQQQKQEPYRQMEMMLRMQDADSVRQNREQQQALAREEMGLRREQFQTATEQAAQEAVRRQAAQDLAERQFQSGLMRQPLLDELVRAQIGMYGANTERVLNGQMLMQSLMGGGMQPGAGAPQQEMTPEQMAFFQQFAQPQQ